MRMFSVAQGRAAEHAEDLKRGLEILGPRFVANLCVFCNGRGERQQFYTAGCGHGHFRSIGVCDYCDGSGLSQQGKPAAESILNQVLEASKRNVSGSI